MKKLIYSTLLIFIFASCSPMHQIRYVPVKWVLDNDRIPMDPPDDVKGRYYYSDLLDYQLFYQIERLVDIPLLIQTTFTTNSRQEALNTNNFDLAANSTWFTNRLGHRDMTVEEIRRGPNQGDGPDPKGPWTVLGGNITGPVPGLIIEDESGDRYLLKFDPPGFLYLSTSAELISSKLLYAFGYNTPENYLVDFNSEILNLSPEAKAKNSKGVLVPFTTQDLGDLFTRVPQKEMGIYRAMASKFEPGLPLGPFSFRGIRRGDINDRIPHEHRRELRGYRVFASLIDQASVQDRNTLASFMETGPGKEGYIMHRLIDFGRSLGSQIAGPKTSRHPEEQAKAGGRFSKYLPPVGAKWRHRKEDFDPEILSVGSFNSQNFTPGTWGPGMTNPAFQYMTKRDAFWATNILMHLSNDHLEAVVEEAKYEDRRVTDYITLTLIARRDKIGRTWLSKMNPVGNFKIRKENQKVLISFDNLLDHFNLAPKGMTSYRYRLKNRPGSQKLITWSETSKNQIKIPSEIIQRMRLNKPYYFQLQTRLKGSSHWGPTVDLVLQRESNGIKWLGLSRRYRT